MNSDEKLNEKNKKLERIWKIRDYIQELEDIKEGILHFLNSRKDLDDVTQLLIVTIFEWLYHHGGKEER